MTAEILIVDDEADIRDVLSDLLQDEGFKTRTAESGEKAIEAVRQFRPHLVLLDIWLGNSQLDGIKVLDIVHKDHKELPIIMMSGHGNIETAVNSIKKGAYDYIEKPFKADRLLVIVRRALEAARLRRENNELKLQIAPETTLIGVSSYIQQLRHTIQKVSSANGRVFITGASGSGKEVVAREIHNLSPRRHTGSYIVFNCATVELESFEEQLFGREENGQITHVGAIEQAHNGTLVLDEICDMPFAIQGQLSRVVQENAFRRKGGSRQVHFNTRFITTTNKSIEGAIQQGLLREELYYRLNVVPIEVLPLKDRKEDIPALVEYFLSNNSKQYGKPLKKLTEEAITALKAYSWPGNIRQLKNIIEWILIMSSAGKDEEITVQMLPSEISANLPSIPKKTQNFELLKLPLKEAREVFEKQYLLSQVSRFSGNISRTATFVGMERSALHRKLRSLGVKRNGTDNF